MNKRNTYGIEFYEVELFCCCWVQEVTKNSCMIKSVPVYGAVKYKAFKYCSG